jgi:hypothetical protein
LTEQVTSTVTAPFAVTLTRRHFPNDLVVITDTYVGTRKWLVRKDLVSNGRMFEDTASIAAAFAAEEGLPELTVEVRSDQDVTIFWASQEGLEPVDRFAVHSTGWRYHEADDQSVLFTAQDGRYITFNYSLLSLFYKPDVEPVTLYALDPSAVYADNAEGPPNLILCPTPNNPPPAMPASADLKKPVETAELGPPAVASPKGKGKKA